MSKRLIALIERARTVEMTSDELYEQRISFAMGMSPWHGPALTREQVERELARTTEGEIAL